jgi:hypothetical protein
MTKFDFSRSAVIFNHINVKLVNCQPSTVNRQLSTVNMIYLKLVLVALFWGGTFIATRIAAQTFEPFMGASIRYIIASVFLFPLAWIANLDFLKLISPLF